MTPVQKIGRLSHDINRLLVLQDLMTNDFNRHNYSLAHFKHMQVVQALEDMKADLHEYLMEYKELQQ